MRRWTRRRRRRRRGTTEREAKSVGADAGEPNA
jgi:hypothetical protein